MHRDISLAAIWVPQNLMAARLVHFRENLLGAAWLELHGRRRASGISMCETTEFDSTGTTSP
jgi:hypothetical protein